MGFMGDLLNYTMDWDFLLLICTLAAAGILIGNQLQKKISTSRLRKTFGWLILGMGIWILYTELFS